MGWREMLLGPMEVVLLAFAGTVIAAIVLFVLVCAWKLLVRGAKYARKPLRRSVRAVLRAVAHAVGAAVVAMFYSLSTAGKAIKASQAKKSEWTFRILFGGALILAVIGAFATIWMFVRR